MRYDAVNAMLLNEFLKEHKKVEEQQTNITQLNSKMANQAAIIAQQQKGMEILTAQLKEQAAQIQKVSAQLELSKSSGAKSSDRAQSGSVVATIWREPICDPRRSRANALTRIAQPRRAAELPNQKMISKSLMPFHFPG